MILKLLTFLGILDLLLAQKRSFTVINKEISDLEAELRDLPKTEDVISTPILDIFADSTAYPFSIKESILILTKDFLYHVNETDILETRSVPTAHQQPFTLTKNLVQNPERVGLLDETHNRIFTYYKGLGNNIFERNYELSFEPKMEKILLAGNLLLGQKGNGVYIATLEQGKFRPLFDGNITNGEHIVALLRTDLVFFLSTNKAIYFMDSYYFVLRKVMDLIEEPVEVIYHRVEGDRIILTRDKKNTVVFYSLVNKFDISKAKRIQFNGKVTFLQDAYILVEKGNNFRVFIIDEVLKNEKSGFEIEKFDEEQIVFGIHMRGRVLDVFTKSPKFGLVTQRIHMKGKIESQDSFLESIFNNPGSLKYLFIIVIPLVIAIVVFLKFREDNAKAAAVVERGMKKKVDKIIGASKKKAVNLSSNADALAGRVKELEDRSAVINRGPDI